MTTKKKAGLNKRLQEKENVNYGKAYSGEVFKDDLKTYDMVQSLLNPLVKKSFFDYLIIISLAINCFIYYYLNVHKELNHLIIPVFVGSYFFWRISYNLGIGVLLYKQSNYNTITNFCQNHRLFNYGNDKDASAIQNFLLLNFKIKYGELFDIKSYPVDFNAWLLFRNFVDLILMQDFFNYFILFVACFIQNAAYKLNDEQPILFYSRWILGVLFILINLIVKLDAHNVIKDFAWYWGDFFYLKINNEELIFDGIFELFPHPMYSIGYIGYYGFALLSNSYLVLIISCVAHFTQFLFLHYVEDPHINKIYNPTNSQASDLLEANTYNIKFKPMLFFNNFNFLRATDYLVLLLNVIVFGFLNFGISATNTKYNFALFILNLVIRVGTTGSYSLILNLQSKYKLITKTYLKYDLDFVDAFNNWCVYYNFLLLININLLLSLTLKEFVATHDLTSFGLSSLCTVFQKDNLFFFKAFVGTFLLFLNIICEKSILNSIGIYAWFYGDFWLPNLNNKQLTRTGIYKYLNNPEKILGICGVWGLSIICFESNYMFILAVIWSLCKVLFISFTETPHMVKLYGENQVNHDSGFSKTFKKIIPEKLRSLSINSKTENSGPTASLKLPRLDHQFEESVISDDEQISFRSPNPFITLSKKNQGYQIELLNAKLDFDRGNLSIPIGTPIKFKYRIPKGHNNLDWVGLYKVVNTFNSKLTTLVSSHNHWIAINPEAYDNRFFGHETTKKADGSFEEGILEFNGDLLYWEPGIYELRYHYNEGHDVALVSNSFELRFEKIQLTSPEIFQKSLFAILDKQFFRFKVAAPGESPQLFTLKDLDSDYVSLIYQYVDAYASKALQSPDLRKNLHIKHLNSYNIEDFKKSLFNKIIRKLSYFIKNSVGSPDGESTNISIEFSKEILIQEKNVKNLSERIIRVQKILTEIAN